MWKTAFLYSILVIVFFANSNKSFLSYHVICPLYHKHNWVVQGHTQKAIMTETMSVKQFMTKGIYDDNKRWKRKRQNDWGKCLCLDVTRRSSAVSKFHILYILSEHAFVLSHFAELFITSKDWSPCFTKRDFLKEWARLNQECKVCEW